MKRRIRLDPSLYPTGQYVAPSTVVGSSPPAPPVMPNRSVASPMHPVPRYVTCAHLGEQIGRRGQRPIYACAKLGETTAEQCESCPQHAPVARTRLEALIPRPRRRYGPKVSQWAVGITTAPRPTETLPQCLDALAAAGWDDATIFAEPGAELRAESGELRAGSGTMLSALCTPLFRWCQRETLYTAWPNFVAGLEQLLVLCPRAQAYMMLQDDAVFAAEQCREYLEAALWPEWPVGFVSVYTSRRYAQRVPGWYSFNESVGRRNYWVWGAVALIFSAESARVLLDARICKAHNLDEQRRNRFVDATLGRAAIECGLAIWYSSPCLVQHVGVTSSIQGRNNKGNHAAGDKRAPHWAGDLL